MNTPESILRQYFGYGTFRPLQKEIIGEVMSGRDTLVLMPTGGGKSVCYQVPALLRPGFTVVVSPLISLMHDQVAALRANGVAAAFLNSSLGYGRQREVEAQLVGGQLKLLYVSPEKLLSDGFIPFLQRMQVSLFAVDEAHCISSWGHDFRPEYQQLNALKSYFPGVPIIALTATADQLTRQDIAKGLELDNPAEFIASFDRPNLNLTVVPGRNRYRIIRKFLENRRDQSGIIYCISRKTTEQLAAKLVGDGFRAAFYHADLASGSRAEVQDKFIRDDIQIICATVAFGMGIDKSNVRFVIHYNLPQNLESYYQEIGRAGRDGLPSDTLLFYSFADVMTWRDIFEKGRTGPYKELRLAKLERMQQYAEANVCRRRILLNYFHEHLPDNCDHCDVCRNPREPFDGTVTAQKALSAVVRSGERASINALVDILLGRRSAVVRSQDWERLKTFGAGRDLRWEEWREYLQQMMHVGLMDVAYDQNYALKVRPPGTEVLYGRRKLELYRPAPKESLVPAEVKPKSKTEQVRDALFEKLRTLRKQLADADGVPPYVVFSDKTLADMAAKRPTNRVEMMVVDGVGVNKYEKYGESFINEILEYLQAEGDHLKSLKHATQFATLKYHKKKMKPEQIARERQLGLSTIYSHLVWLYTHDHGVDLRALLDESALTEIHRACFEVGTDQGLKALYDHLSERYDYTQIRVGMAIFDKEVKRPRRAPRPV
ncbi:MAG: DNA helicase RecQ [Catalinimonas sp.]